MDIVDTESEFELSDEIDLDRLSPGEAGSFNFLFRLADSAFSTSCCGS